MSAAITVPGASCACFSRTELFQTFNVFPLIKVKALGHGSRPLTRRSSSSAFLLKSRSPIFFEIMAAYGVGLSSGCFSRVAVPSKMDGKVCTRSSAPACASLSNKLPPVSSLASGTTILEIISPVSRPVPICIIVTPDSFSPSITACWIGAAPRYLGSRDAWILIHPNLGISRMLFGMICPNAATMMMSGARFFSSSTNSGSLTFTGCSTGIPCFSASSFTGVGIIVLPLPFGLSGCVITASTSYPFSASATRGATAKSGVPI